MSRKIADFLINEGLYGKGLAISVNEKEELRNFLEEEFKVDIYCCSCGMERVFTAPGKPKRKSIGEPMNTVIPVRSSSDSIETPNEPTLEDLISQEELQEYKSLVNRYPEFQKKFSCAMNSDHTLIFSFLIIDDHIIKYGQHPSLADLNNINLKKYRKILGKKYNDFSKGIGLYSHGVGAGSLIYLRRIFEDLIEEAHQKATDTLGWDEENYFSQRMNEKILTLKNYLPQYLVENRKIYGILSKGIHHLPEEICMDIFPVMKVGIELILDEKIETEEREKKKKETTELIQRLQAQLD
ncbi:hypothetical protein [Priestia megaterium]|uniref:hypothetical protein n=1 Tax=Priestia megaterium TaxID=1404 RepID=UPI0020A0F59F|nr:hypothetical protein [Priestia megaterium]MCP1450342.1 hypothetical protein [Priestia megaterium]